MKKLVNGKVIEIDNLELFDAAQEGLALQRTTSSMTSCTVDSTVDNSRIKRIISLYHIFYKSMAYPLYAIERDIKYATLGNFIKHAIREDICMWVNNGLYIIINREKKLALNIVNNTWAVTEVGSIEEDNTEMKNFKDSLGFEEYSWLLEKVINKEKDSNFYKEFMPEFMKACNMNEMVVRWELENILNFISVPKEIKVADNTIVDVEKQMEFTLDIYSDGYIKTGEVESVWSIGNGGVGSSTIDKRIKKYNYKVYGKELSTEEKSKGDIKICRLNGAFGMFNALCREKDSIGKGCRFPIYKGYIVGACIVFEVNKNVYICKANRVTEAKMIASNAELYSTSRNIVYIYKKKRISSAIEKVTLYSYNITENKTKLCRINYMY